MKKFKVLDEAFANLARLLHSNGSKLIHDGRLLAAKRELQAYKKGGKQSERRLHRAVALICEVACEEFLRGTRSNDE